MTIFKGNSKITSSEKNAHVAQEVEHLHGKQEVTGSSPVVGSKIFQDKKRQDEFSYISSLRKLKESKIINIIKEEN